VTNANAAYDTTVAFAIPLVALLMPLLQWDIKNTSGILVYSKEYSFPIFLSAEAGYN
jgi:homoserine dehydrogenase